jgi:hypothetical protein
MPSEFDPELPLRLVDKLVEFFHQAAAAETSDQLNAANNLILSNESEWYRELLGARLPFIEKAKAAEIPDRDAMDAFDALLDAVKEAKALAFRFASKDDPLYAGTPTQRGLWTQNYIPLPQENHVPWEELVTRGWQEHNSRIVRSAKSILTNAHKAFDRYVTRIPRNGSSADTASAFRHSPDYASCVYKGEPFIFTNTQKAVVKVLHEAHLKGVGVVGDDYLLEAVDSGCKLLRDVFKTGGVQHPAWGTLIVDAGRGNRRLDL